MSVPRVVIAGASGFIGQRLAAEYRARGQNVLLIGRTGTDATWSHPASVRGVIDGADVVINLAGRSVGCRYTDANRTEIFTSRVETTRSLGEAIAAADDPPELWLNASTGTIYRHATDRPQTEDEGEIGTGFSVDVATAWEREFFAADTPETRRVALRMSIVLGDGPAVQKLALAARCGLGGPQLDGWWFAHDRYRGIGPHATPAHPSGFHTGGRQRFSWIHLDDVVAAIDLIRADPSITGPVNLAAPQAATNAELMRALRRSVRMPVGLPAPRWMLETGMLLLRQESELLLKSRWVYPERLLRHGFAFGWTDLDAAVADAVGGSAKKR